MTKEESCALLRDVCSKEGRLPKKSDFTLEQVQAIKALWGPWRYALEEAGLIESKREELLTKNKEKRRRARLKRKSGI